MNTIDTEADQLLQEVLNSYKHIADHRQLEIVQKTIKAVHTLARELKLSRAEWVGVIEFLTAVGQKCSDDRQEFILLSDLLGLSTLIEKTTYPTLSGETASSVQGPFYVPDAQAVENGGSLVVNSFDDGIHALIQGRIKDANNHPIPAAIIEVWQTAPNQMYAVQDQKQDRQNLRGKLTSAADGSYAFKTLKPVPYSVPMDGPCGVLLTESRRHGMRTAHIHFRISAPGFETLITQIYPADDPYLDSDTVFGVDDSLIVEFTPAPGEEDYALIAEFDFILVEVANAHE